MTKSRSEWICQNCKEKYIAFWGSCKACGQSGTLQKVQLVPPKSKATLTQRSLSRRSKNSERNVARHMVEVDGVDPNFEKIASSTGRVGHITNMRIDAISKNYVTENKNRVLPQWLIKAWLLIQQRAIDFNKKALLHLDPPNSPKEFVLNGVKYKMSSMYILTQERHDALIASERELDALREGVVQSALTPKLRQPKR